MSKGKNRSEREKKFCAMQVRDVSVRKGRRDGRKEERKRSEERKKHDRKKEGKERTTAWQEESETALGIRATLFVRWEHISASLSPTLILFAQTVDL